MKRYARLTMLLTVMAALGGLVAVSAGWSWAGENDAVQQKKPRSAESNDTEVANGDRSLDIRESVYALAFSRDGKLLAAGHNHEETVTIWDITTGQRRAVLKHQSVVVALAFSPNGRLLATGGYDSKVRLWETATWKEKATIDEHSTPRPIVGVAFVSDDELVSASDGILVAARWDVGGATPRKLAAKDYQAFVTSGFRSLAVSPDSKIIALGGEGVVFWDTEHDKVVEIPKDKVKGAVHSLAFLPDGTTVIGGCHDAVYLWNAKTGEERKKYDLGRNTVTSVPLLFGGELFATQSPDGIGVFQVDTGQQVHSFDHPPGSIEVMIASPRHDVLAIGIRSRNMRFNKIELRSLKPVEKSVRLH